MFSFDGFRTVNCTLFILNVNRILPTRSDRAEVTRIDHCRQVFIPIIASDYLALHEYQFAMCTFTRLKNLEVQLVHRLYFKLQFGSIASFVFCGNFFCNFYAQTFWTAFFAKKNVLNVGVSTVKKCQSSLSTSLRKLSKELRVNSFNPNALLSMV